MAGNEPKPPRKGSIAELIAGLREKYGRDVVSFASDVKPLERLSTGIVKLDSLIGGGWPKGRIVEIWGPQSAGKTTILYTTIASVQKIDPKAQVAFFDQENTFNAEWAAVCGVDLARLLRIAAIAAEEAGELLIRFVKQKWALCAIDSVVEMLPEKELKREMEAESYSPVARVLAKLLPKVTVLQSSSPTVVIVTNQVRDKIGFMFGAGQKAPGGQALYHYDSIRLRVQRKGPIMDAVDKKKQIGIEVALKVVKSKVSPEGRECRIGIVNGKGVVEDVASPIEESGSDEE